jgi:hypothetical protein
MVVFLSRFVIVVCNKTGAILLYRDCTKTRQIYGVIARSLLNEFSLGPAAMRLPSSLLYLVK